MSEIRVNNITNRDGSTGTTVAGIPVVNSNSHFVVPTGRTGQRYADGGENIVRDGLVLYLDAKYSYPDAAANTKSILSAVEVLVVAGGGAGGGYHGGGGGGGGVIYSSSHSITPGSAITATVGPGGTAPTSASNTGNPGGNSVFGALTAIGGGAGISQGNAAQARNNGGSGGGGCDGSASVNHPGGSGTALQGNQGGDVFGSGTQLAVSYGTAGGGGAGGVGGDGGVINGGFGGPGLPFSISGTSTYYAGGGGGTHLGSSSITNYGIGGIGGGGTGGISPSPHNSAFRSSTSGSPNTGGGGGGHLYNGLGGGAGGSGVVIVRYPGPQKAIGGTITNIGGYTIHTFTSSGTFTPNGSPGSGTTWYDLSGNENHGELKNGVGYNAANGGSLVFDGVDDTVIVGSKDTNLNPAQVTLSVWLNRSSAINYSHFAGVPVSNNSWSPPYITYGFEFISTTDNVSFVVGFQNNEYAHTAAENTGLTGIGTWVNITGTYDENYRKIYINGNLITSAADNRKLATASGNFTLGAENYTQTNYPLNGKIPITLVYNRALTAQEVQQNFNATRSRYGI